MIQNAGLQTSVTQQTSTQPAQTVIGEIPVGGTRVDDGSTVALTVSSGPSSVNVPSVVGEPVAQAKKAITSAGLKVGRTISEQSDQFAAGIVVDRAPLPVSPSPRARP